MSRMGSYHWHLWSDCRGKRRPDELRCDKSTSRWLPRTLSPGCVINTHCQLCQTICSFSASFAPSLKWGAEQGYLLALFHVGFLPFENSSLFLLHFIPLLGKMWWMSGWEVRHRTQIFFYSSQNMWKYTPYFFPPKGCGFRSTGPTWRTQKVHLAGPWNTPADWHQPAKQTSHLKLIGPWNHWGWRRRDSLKVAS